MKKYLAFAALLVVCFAIWKWMAYLQHKMPATCTTPAQIALATTPAIDDARQIVADWRSHPPALRYAKENVLVDFLFVPAYVALFVFLAFWCGTLLPNELWPRVARSMAVLAIIAGACDWVENVGLLMTMAGDDFRGVAMMTTIVSTTKWLLLFVVTFFIVQTIALAILQRGSSAAPPSPSPTPEG